MDGIEIKAVPALGVDYEAVFDSDGKCIGVVNNSRRYPWKRMFFAYADGGFYYGMTSLEAVQRYFNWTVDL